MEAFIVNIFKYNTLFYIPACQQLVLKADLKRARSVLERGRPSNTTIVLTGLAAQSRIMYVGSKNHQNYLGSNSDLILFRIERGLNFH